MSTTAKNPSDTAALKCPECQAQLKRRRTRTPDACEMVCGGCGRAFDVCDFETVDALQKGRDPG
jgi:hypothetical protein